MNLNGSSSTPSVITTSSLHSIDLSSNYGGIIELSTYKKARNSLFQLFDYVSSSTPSFFGLHVFISLWRIIQYFGPALACNYRNFWGEGSIMLRVLDIGSVIFHFIPVSFRGDYSFIFLYIYSIIFFLFYVFILVSANYLTQNAKLPKGVPIFISVFMSTVGYIFQPVCSMLIGELIGRMIMDSEKYANLNNILSLVLAAFFSTIYFWLYSAIYSVSIIFKPDSLMTIVPSVQILTLVVYYSVTLTIGLASQLSRIPRMILTVIGLLEYGASIPIILLKGSFVTEFYLQALLATSFTSIVLLLIVVIFDAMEKMAQEYMIIIVIAVWISDYLVTHFIYQAQMTRNARLLDKIEEDNELIDLIKSPIYLIDLIVTGFRITHPICISFRLLKMSIERFPKNADIWMLFAKFTAIYPEENQQLSFIAVGISQNRIKGALAKYTHQQIKAIMRQRETNLIPPLKTKLDKINKQVQGTKHKVRYIWDLIIQGNIKELESVIHRAYKSIDSTEAEILHLTNQFPNSRFVARCYARFLRDVVADHAGHKQWAANVSLLQRGISVTSDQAHELGLRAFQNLPQTLDVQLQVQPTQGVLTEDTITQDIDPDDDHAAIDAELRMSVRESINKLKIPSYRAARIVRFAFLFIFFVAPVITIAIYLPIYLNSIISPLEFMYYIAELRTTIFQALGSSEHYMLENLNATNQKGVQIFPLHENGGIEGEEDPPHSFGGNYDSRKQSEFLNNKLSSILPNLRSLMSYHPDNEIMNQVRNTIFGENLTFISVSEPEHLPGWQPNTTNASLTTYQITPSLKSAQSATMQIIIHINKLIQLEEIPFDALNQPFATVPFNNARTITNQLSDALDLIKEYVILADDDMQHTIMIVVIVICCSVPILYTISSVLIIVRTTKEKMMIYKCLASLPKNVVSRVADSFKVLKKEEDDEMKSAKTHDEELNKQEENMLKIFATSSDSGGGKAADIITITIVTFIIVVLHVLITIFIYLFIRDTSQKQSHVTPHFDFIMGAYAYDLASLMILLALPATAHPLPIYHIVNFDYLKVLYIISEWQNRSINNFRAVRFGDKSANAIPFQSLGASIDLTKNSSECKDGQKPLTPHDCYNCWSPDILLSYSQMKVQSYLTHFLISQDVFPGNDTTIHHIWHSHQVHIFDEYFSPMFENLINIVSKIFVNQQPQVIAFAFIFLIIAIIAELVHMRFLYISENRQKFALRLLLHCPGNVVVSNSHITALLSGNFHEKQIDSTTRDAEFYEILVKYMPDSIIILDLDGNIKSANNATQRIYGIDTTHLTGSHITKLGDRFKDGNAFKEIFDKAEKVSCDKNCVYVDDEGNDVHIEMSFTVLTENYLVTTRDVTQTVNYNLLITDEKMKSDRLLSSILPARLVPRVQAGEKNISFAVQSVTIVFMDIVSFTPWCGSLPAATVMKTLNLLFKEYDALVAVHTTMTKIKCIGDCYMAAGGIFAEINQPAVHAKDVVEFGLDAIESLEELNVKIDQKLQIRVGINTGGPIVAGVLGTEKPTFEILGPTINMAQQMEHHGIPMKVHISRAVYELIYGGNFEVKERGEIEIKNGTVVTYVIKGRNQK
ncbi:Adenylate and Guanylate cyclase catalytic domain containing protein [Tritrichomonas foetus]|uniref:Adenylate and Guanylate cyclase catalytic domain containing protein n=1 Tax=Tritrichomonas foetus TaxID=1144522 RepID=A0A1J4JEQ6_9EUKA|nr:Adenylate and Guanylate cyclase catalytic domain containing protein [Tritrichomonas foetus]|eukprot:OHS96775.1 Adenylate and Guanylate cyclase catalytic domain containing protein [Tritrichomonas foetus]